MCLSSVRVMEGVGDLTRTGRVCYVPTRNRKIHYQGKPIVQPALLISGAQHVYDLTNLHYPVLVLCASKHLPDEQTHNKKWQTLYQPPVIPTAGKHM